MERKNGRRGAVQARLSRAVIWTFCLAFVATFAWENTKAENRLGHPQHRMGTGSQAILPNAWYLGAYVFPKSRTQEAAREDRHSEEVIVKVAVSVPCVTPTITDLPVDRPQPVAAPAYLTRGERFHPLIVRVSKEHNVDPALVKAIIMAESGYNPQAVSKVGARGLMQLMPGTADSLGVQDIFDPEENVSGGVKYLKQLLNEFGGEIKLALAAYNAGSRKVKTYKGIPPIGATQIYIDKVIKYYQHYKKRLAGSRENT